MRMKMLSFIIGYQDTAPRIWRGSSRDLRSFVLATLSGVKPTAVPAGLRE